MAAVFYVIGGLGVLLGLAWSAIVVMQPSMEGARAGVLTAARIVAVTPGLSIAFAGLLIMAIGGVLSRLDTLVLLNRAVVRDLENKRPANNISPDERW